jgi:hypothetical protein
MTTKPSDREAAAIERQFKKDLQKAADVCTEGMTELYKAEYAERKAKTAVKK